MTCNNQGHGLRPISSPLNFNISTPNFPSLPKIPAPTSDVPKPSVRLASGENRSTTTATTTTPNSVANRLGMHEFSVDCGVLPHIIDQLGFSTSQSQLLTISPSLCGGVSAWVVGRYADRFKWRMPFIVGSLVVVVVATALGILMGLSSNIEGNVGPMYFGIVLAQIGIYPLLPGVSTWTSNNLGTSWKRSIGLAWLLAAGNLGSEYLLYPNCNLADLSIQASSAPTSSSTSKHRLTLWATACPSQSSVSALFVH